MDKRLVAWARAVKSRRRRGAGAGPAALPPLWLFTDPGRMPDLVAAVARLPRGLCGVVFRHDGVPGRAALGRRLARLCRARNLVMVSAAEAVPGAGLHRRGGRVRVRGGMGAGFCTASAHGVADLVRARGTGAALAFLSPVYPTATHPGARSMGPVRWARLSLRHGRVAALGGVDGVSVKRLPRRCCAVGAIGALLD